MGKYLIIIVVALCDSQRCKKLLRDQNSKSRIMSSTVLPILGILF